MYIVTVHCIYTDEAIDTRNFEFGTFAEIGYWLDDKFYNDPQYKVVIKIADTTTP